MSSQNPLKYISNCSSYEYNLMVGDNFVLNGPARCKEDNHLLPNMKKEKPLDGKIVPCQFYLSYDLDPLEQQSFFVNYLDYPHRKASICQAIVFSE